MKRNIIIGTVFFTMLAMPGAYAVTGSGGSTSASAPETISTPSPTPTATPSTTPTPSPTSSPSSTPTPTPNIDTLAPPSQSLIQQNPWQAVSVDPAPNNSEVEPSGQDEPESWAVVDANGNTINTIVCDRDYCGSGWIPTRFDGFTPVEFARVVLQSARNPQTGQFGGWHWGNYNFNSNTWTQTNGDGSVYEIPTEYGAQPICIQNCPTPSPTPIPSPSESEEPETPNIEDPEIVVQERRVLVKPSIVNNSVVINKKLNDKVFRNQVLIVATKGNKKKIWTQQVSGKIVNVKIPRNYLFWNISIRYVIG